MKVLIAFIVAFGIGAASRWTGVPFLAPQAIVGALLIVAMSTGYVSADRLLKRNSSPSKAASVSAAPTAALATHACEGLPNAPQAIAEPEADTIFWRQKSEVLQVIIADLLLTNQQLRVSGSVHASPGSGKSVTSRLNLEN